MAKTNWPEKVDGLRRRYPAIRFEPGDTFRWSPTLSTVFYADLRSEEDFATLLHETGHALARHQTYHQDITLLKLEREAWDIAKDQLAPLYGLTIDETVIEVALDSYRKWLHARSICPTCQSNGVQKDETHYSCLICRAQWRVNDARHCQLRRYSVPTPHKTAR